MVRQPVLVEKPYYRAKLDRRNVMSLFEVLVKAAITKSSAAAAPAAASAPSAKPGTMFNSPASDSVSKAAPAAVAPKPQPRTGIFMGGQELGRTDSGNFNYAGNAAANASGVQGKLDASASQNRYMASQAPSQAAQQAAARPTQRPTFAQGNETRNYGKGVDWNPNATAPIARMGANTGGGFASGLSNWFANRSQGAIGPSDPLRAAATAGTSQFANDIRRQPSASMFTRTPAINDNMVQAENTAIKDQFGPNAAV